jgi:hypothetical protein
VVPSAYKISIVAKTCNSRTANKMHLTEFLLAALKPLDINNLAEKQTHLSPEECEKLLNVLLDF